MGNDEKWFELLDAAREAHATQLGDRLHPVSKCRFCQAILAFPASPSIFDQLPDPPAAVAPTLAAMPDENELGGFRATDPSTSRLAALANYPKSGKQRHRILMAVHARGPSATCDLADLLPHHVASTRLSELSRGGWVRDSSLRRMSPLGSEQIVWELTDKARTSIAERENRAA